MEVSKPLAIESFSYSWLSNKRPSLDRHEEPGQCTEESHSFDFNVSISDHLTSTIVHADELFSNGLIRPASSVEYPKAAIPEHTVPLQPVPVNLPARKTTHHGLLRRWRRSSEQVMRKCFRCIKYLYRKEGFCTRKNVRVDDVDHRAQEVRSWHGSSPASPWSYGRAYYSAGGDRWSDVESSIYEAVLHCKRSIGTLSSCTSQSD